MKKISEKLKQISVIRFIRQLFVTRKLKLAFSSSKPPADEYPLNIKASELHPGIQYARISEVTDHGNGTRSYTLIPDAEKGTVSFAYFEPGQYISVYAEKDGIRTARPYSLSSSPKQSLSGIYRITISTVSDGFVSGKIAPGWTTGTSIAISGPHGEFTFDPVRDSKNVVGIAGGSGITPFISMARAVSDGDLECDLTILYGARKRSDILFEDELREICSATDKVRIIYILSEEEKKGYDHGLITKEKIKQYSPECDNCSIFVCGPDAMYRFISEELSGAGIENKYIRFEIPGERFADGNIEKKQINITVHISGETKTVEGTSDISILRNLENNGIRVSNRCRCGECGYCRACLIKGDVSIDASSDRRRAADREYNWIYTCSTFALTDIEIDLPKAEI